MKKATKILGIAVCCVFLFAGASFAALIDDLQVPGGQDYVFTLEGADWASLNVHLAGDPGDYTYTYTVAVLADPTVHILELPVVDGHYNVVGQGSEGIPYLAPVPMQDSIQFLWDELPAGSTSAPIFIWSDYDPELALATVYNSGQHSSATVAAAIVGAGGGPGGDPAPEPATLLLLGSGLLGAGAFRRLRSRKTTN